MSDGKDEQHPVIFILKEREGSAMMDIRTIRYVLAIARYQNLTRAADALHVGQPTLSKFLASLEDELGVRLFRRVGHRYLLTQAGERYTEKASRILFLAEDLNAEMADIREKDIGRLSVAFAHMRCSYILADTLPVFQKRYPHVRVQVFEGNSNENDRRLISGEIEAAFYSKPRETNPMLSYQTLAEEELLICTAADHPVCRLAEPAASGRYPVLDLADLKNERILMMQPYQRTRQIVDQLLDRHGIHYSNVFHITNIPAIIGLVASGYGVSFVFDSHLRHRPPGLPISCCSIRQGPVTAEFVAATRKNSYLSRYLTDFIDIVKEMS